jgi:hypothetical protein
MSKEYNFKYTLNGTITIVADSLEEANEKAEEYISSEAHGHNTHWGFDDGSSFGGNTEYNFEKVGDF